MVLISNELRKTNSPSYLVKKMYELSKKEKRNCIIESTRTAVEIECLKSKGNFYLLSVDANIFLRYQRISKRDGEKDNKTFKEFVQHEKREMES